MPDIRDAAVRQALADAYITHGGNQSKAAVAVGYTPAYARSSAHRLFADQDVRRRIEQRNADMDGERIARMEEINAFWTAIMRDEERDLRDRMKASELRAKAAGGFLDKGDAAATTRVVISGERDLTG